jgi:hypothetical protein
LKQPCRIIGQGCLRLLPDGKFAPGSLVSDGILHFSAIFRVFAQIDRLCPRLNYQLFSIWAPSLRDSRKSSVGLARFRRLLGDDLLPLSQ